MTLFQKRVVQTDIYVFINELILPRNGPQRSLMNFIPDDVLASLVEYKNRREHLTMGWTY